MFIPMNTSEVQKCRTAIFNDAARDLQPNLPTEPVYLLYMHHTFNVKYKRTEAVFACYTDAAMSQAALVGTWFEGALEHFNQ
jgi:hypothetical protein